MHRLDGAHSAPPVLRAAASSHGLGLAAALELARALRYLPRHCLVFAIEGSACTLSAALCAALRRVVAEEEIRCRLNLPRRATSSPAASLAACGAISDRSPGSR